MRPIEHVHPLVRTERQLERVLKEVEQAPGIVLYTVVKKELIEEIERRCRELKVPCLHVLEPIMKVFESYLGAPQTPIVAGQHVLDADYFAPHRRAQLRHGARRRPAAAGPQRGRHHHPRHLAHLQDADQHLSGPARLQDRQPAAGARHRAAGGAHRSRTRPSWSAWSPAPSASPRSAATACSLIGDRNLDDYVDRTQIANEIQYSRRLCARHGWPVIDVTRRSVEETAATIIRLLHDRRGGASAAEQQETGDG